MTPKDKSLPKAVRRFIVEAFACFQTPSEIAEMVKERFDIAIVRSSVAHYDPEHSPKVAKEWRALHAATRARFLEDASRIAIAHQPFRLQELERIYRHAMNGKAKNLPLALQTLEQAAKERGGSFTNARSFAGALGSFDITALGDEQLRRLASGEDLLAVLGDTAKR